MCHACRKPYQAAGPPIWMTSSIELSDRTWELLQIQKQQHGLSTDNEMIHKLLYDHLGIVPDHS